MAKVTELAPSLPDASKYHMGNMVPPLLPYFFLLFPLPHLFSSSSSSPPSYPPLLLTLTFPLLPLFMGSVGSLTTSLVGPARSLAFFFSFSPLCLLPHQVLCILPPKFSKPSSHLLAHSHLPSQATPVWTQQQAPAGFHCDDPPPHGVQPPNHSQRESLKSSHPLEIS